MTRLVALALVFAGFAALNVYAVEQYGFVGFFVQLFANAATLTAAVDLTISLALIVLWMWGDAAERALPFWPYAAVTLALGSLGSLAYLIHRELRAGSPRRAVA
jgi:MFS superfamily sulfate permease-like transporter